MNLRPEHLSEALSATVGEEVEVLYASVDGQQLLDAGGRPVPSSVRDRSYAGLEITADGERVALVRRLGDEGGDLASRMDPEMVLRIANAAMIVQRRADIAGWYRSLGSWVAAADAARRRLERDLHDGAQQLVLALLLELHLLTAELSDQAVGPGPTPSGLAQLRTAASEVSSALDELRAIAHGIHPSALTQGGIQVATDLLAHQLGVRIELVTDVGLTPAPEMASYRLIEAAAAEAARRGCSVSASLRHDGGLLRVRVELSDGGSFDPGSAYDRVEALYGDLTGDLPLEVVLPLSPDLALPTDVPTGPTALDGTYLQTVDPDDLRRVGFTETSTPNGHTGTSDTGEPINLLVENSGTFEYTLDRGRFRWRQDQPGAVVATESRGRFLVRDQEVTFVEDLYSNDGRQMVLRFVWSTDADGHLVLEAADEWNLSRVMAATVWVPLP